MAPYLITMLWLLMPQNVTINGNVTLSNVTIASGIEIQQAVTSVDCETLCLAVWALAEEDRPFEIDANSTRIKIGDACRCTSGPGLKLRLDGSE